MDVGIFGGSFNPPHVAHLVVAETVREQFGLDRVLWIPTHNPPHKPVSSLAPTRDRIEMVRLAIEGNEAFEVSDIELQRDGTSYTVDTICALQEMRPDHDYHLIVGGDTLLQLGTWYRPDEIVRRVPLLVYRRPGADLSAAEARFANHARVAETALLEVSGEAIRARLQAGKSVRYLLPDAVLRYINEKGLYR